MISNDIRFKKMNESDLKLLYQWFQVPHVLKWYAKNEIYTFEMIQKKYLPRINDTSIQNFIIYDHDKPVGYIQLYLVSHHLPEGIRDYSHPLFNDIKPSDLSGIDLFVADENYLHIGFSSKALELFIKMHFKDKFKAILVDPLKTNIVAISFFERNGFKHITSQANQHDLMFNDILIFSKKSDWKNYELIKR